MSDSIAKTEEEQSAPPLRLGVTGHINIDPAAVPRVAADTQRQLQAAKRAGAVCVVCALADGFDLLAAEAALCLHIPVSAVLPFPECDFFADSVQQERRRAILADALTQVCRVPVTQEQNIFAAVSDFVADACDMLLAGWDGCECDKAGGTYYTVHRAQASGVPILRVTVPRQ